MKRTKWFIICICVAILLTTKTYAAADPAYKISGKPIKAVWIATIVNLDYPTKRTLDTLGLEKEADKIVKHLSSLGITDIFFQVRPTADAFYESRIFPVSQYLTGCQGVWRGMSFDPLKYWIEICHKQNIRIHAWVNPYRASKGTAESPQIDVTKLARNNPARINPSWVIPYADGQLYFDPGEPYVQALVIDGIMEIVENYDVDGIHIDDYFYPYPIWKEENGKQVAVAFNDNSSYSRFGRELESLENFRRRNVDNLVKNIYEAIKYSHPNVQFSISPFAVWADKSNNPNGSNTKGGLQSYYDLYVDSRKWVENDWMDFIVPQIYWSFEATKTPFNKVYDWWSEVTIGTHVGLVAGHAAYKLGGKEKGFESSDQLTRQVVYTKNAQNYYGNAFFGYSEIRDDTLNIVNAISN